MTYIVISVLPTLESFISGRYPDGAYRPRRGGGGGSGRGADKKLLENRTLNGGFWGHFKLNIVNICYLFAGKNVFTANLDPKKYIILSELICLMEMPQMF